jgi:hypothetical protein
MLTQVDEKERKFIVAYVNHSNNNEGYNITLMKGIDVLLQYE